VAFLVALGGGALALWRAPRSPHGFALGVALVLGLFFAFNKQAFANYYYFVIGALCVAAATAPVRREIPAHSTVSAPPPGAA
jgi:4-amino-4-deoxy-L-arabinose transferase-like glycosyltransferase